jgi:hypothetical protein
MSFRSVIGDVALAGVLPAGANNSPAVGVPGSVADVVVMVHVSAVSGTTPTLNVTLEQSADGSTGWTAVTGGAVTQLTAAGSALANAAVTQPYIRVVATVGGTASPTVTGRVALLAFAA